MNNYTQTKYLMAVALGLLIASPTYAAKPNPYHRNFKIDGLVVSPKEDIVVKGRILDDKGQPIPGANIMIKGTTTGVITDPDGSFSITVPDANSVLLISFVGFTTEEVAINGRTDISLSLNPDITTLSDVVVVGYGTQQKRDVTGAVGSVSEDQIKAVPVMGADQAMQGRVAGVQVTNSSGAPGGGVQVRIRGVGSLGSGAAVSPLYVVDGIPLAPWNEGVNNIGIGANGGTNQSSPLSTINPNDIESIEVLKDASATSIYGARASNGVVLITTKSGKAGKMRIDFNAYYGVQTLARKIPMVTQKQEAINFFESAFAPGDGFAVPYNEGTWTIANPYLLNGGNTDWIKEGTRVAPMQNYNLSLSGGTDKVQYLVSADYFDQKGILINSESKRFSGRINLDAQLNKWIKIGVHNTVSNQSSLSLNMDDYTFSTWRAITGSNPITPVRFNDGSFFGSPYITDLNAGGLDLQTYGAGATYFGENPIGKALRDKNEINRFRVLSNTFAELQLAKGLTFRSSIGIDVLNNEIRTIKPVFRYGFLRPYFDPSYNGTTIRQPRSNNWVAEQVLSYKKTFAEVHSINVIAGVSAQKFSFSNLSGSGIGSLNEDLNELSNQNDPILASASRVVSTLASQFARATYSFKDRYLLTATVRRDGSSRFGPENRFAIFPSASVGWRVSEESFMKNISFINDLKIRTSYGITGNQEIGDFQFLNTAAASRVVMGTITPGLTTNTIPNTGLKWETNKQTDVGMDMSLLRGRVNIVVDWYNRNVDNLLDSRSIALSSGLGRTITDNIGSIRNTGWEYALNTVNIDSKVRWTTDINFSTNKNTVTALGQAFITGIGVDENDNSRQFNRTVVGRGIGEFWLLEEGAQFQTWQEVEENSPDLTAYRTNSNPNNTNRHYFMPGDFTYINHSGNTRNGVAIINDSDRVFMGSPMARYFGGFNNTISYKGITLSMFLTFQGGNKIWNMPARFGSVDSSEPMWRSSFENRWTAEDPRPTSTPIERRGSLVNLPSNRFLENGSFIRGRNVTLAYDFPEAIASKAKLNRARVYFQVNNVFTITKYTGWDPEVSSLGSNGTTAGIDLGGYPNARSFVVGVNLGLQ